MVTSARLREWDNELRMVAIQSKHGDPAEPPRPEFIVISALARSMGVGGKP